MANTWKFDTDSIGLPEDIIPQTPCSKIVIYEEEQKGTAAYWVKQIGGPGAVFNKQAAGAPVVIEAPQGSVFPAGRKVGEIYSDGALMTMNQVES